MSNNHAIDVLPLQYRTNRVGQFQHDRRSYVRAWKPCEIDNLKICDLLETNHLRNDLLT